MIDPIDGTKNYVRGVPVWATLIALLEGEQAVVGVASAPALGRRWWAAPGGGAWICACSAASHADCRCRGWPIWPRRASRYSSLRGWAEVGRRERSSSI